MYNKTFLIKFREVFFLRHQRRENVLWAKVVTDVFPPRMGDLIWALMDDCEEEAGWRHSGQGLSWSTGAASEAHSWGWGGDKHRRDPEAWWETTAQLWAKVFTLLRLHVPWTFLTSLAFERTKGNSISSVSCSLFILIQMNSIILTLAATQETIGLVLLPPWGWWFMRWRGALSGKQPNSPGDLTWESTRSPSSRHTLSTHPKPSFSWTAGAAFYSI